MLQTKPKIKIQFLSYLGELFNEKWRYIILYGGRSGGKSRAVAEALLLRGRNKQLRILCTREVQNTIKDSVHKLLSDLIEEYGFDDYSVTKDSVVNSVTGTEFIFRGLHRNITEIKSTEGVDICWIEEGQAVTKESLDIITPTIRKPGSQIIVTFNRVDELDPVYVHYVLNRKPNSYVLKINYDVLEEAGLLPDVIKSEIEGDRSDPELFTHKWLGEPISQGEFSIIPRTEILNAMQRDTEGDGAVIIGVDVARMGDDRTVFWKRKGLKTLGFEVYQHKRTTEVCDLLERFAETKDGDADISKTIDIKIDDTGVGGGVTDEMKKRGYNALPVNFGGRPNNNNKYPNLISEAWFELAEVIREVQLPMNNDLVMELSTRQWHQDNKGKRAIESKQDYKKRGFRSPDLADACIICYYSGKKRIKAFTAKPSGW